MTAEVAGVIIAVVALIQGIGVALVQGMMSRKERDTQDYRRQREEAEKERDKEREKREQSRKQLDVAILALAFATSEGTEVLLHQAQGEQVNGNVDSALESIHNARRTCNELINKTALGA